MPSMVTPVMPLDLMARPTTRCMLRPTMAQLLAHAALAMLLEHDVRRRERRRVGRERRRDPRPAGRVHQFRPPAHGGKREPVRERLAERREVGRDAREFLVPAGREAEPRLHFVEDQCRAAGVADRARPLDPLLRGHPFDDRLEDDGGEPVRHRPTRRCRARPRRRTAPRGKSFCTPSGTPGAARAPVMPAEVAAADDHVAAGICPRERAPPRATASAPLLRNCTFSAHGTSSQKRSATSTSSTLGSPETFPLPPASITARVTCGSAYPIATEPSAIVQSTSDVPSIVSMWQPDARAKCVGPNASSMSASP